MEAKKRTWSASEEPVSCESKPPPMRGSGGAESGLTPSKLERTIPRLTLASVQKKKAKPLGHPLKFLRFSHPLSSQLARTLSLRICDSGTDIPDHLDLPYVRSWHRCTRPPSELASGEAQNQKCNRRIERYSSLRPLGCFGRSLGEPFPSQALYSRSALVISWSCGPHDVGDRHALPCR
jgi:hypothetical protein